MKTDKSLGLKIKGIRETKGLSQDRFGKKIGLTGKSISAYENGRCLPPLKVLESIATVYNTAVFCMGNEAKSALENRLQEIKNNLAQIEEMLKSNLML